MTGIAMVGVFGDGEEACGNSMALIVTSSVEMKGRIRVSHIVMNLNMVVNMTLLCTVN